MARSKVTGAGAQRTVSVPVTNTGHRPGSEGVQIYVVTSPGDVSRPPKEPAGFSKLTLDPSETGTAEVTLSERSFARGHSEAHQWAAGSDRYRLLVAVSAADVRSTIVIEV